MLSEECPDCIVLLREHTFDSYLSIFQVYTHFLRSKATVDQDSQYALLLQVQLEVRDPEVFREQKHRRTLVLLDGRCPIWYNHQGRRSLIFSVDWKGSLNFGDPCLMQGQSFVEIIIQEHLLHSRVRVKT